MSIETIVAMFGILLPVEAIEPGSEETHRMGASRTDGANHRRSSGENRG